MNIVPNLNAARILVVEDDLKMADRIVAVLRGAGYYVQNAYNSGDALAADHTRFDLALVNAAMRDREGRAILDSIAAHPTFSRLKILTMTDNAQVGVGRHTLRRAYEDTELLSRVSDLLGQKKASTGELPPARNGATGTLTRPRPISTSDDSTEPSRVALDAHLQQQLAELKTLSSLGRSISSVLDLSEVLNQIVEAATTLTHAEEGMILLPDEEGKALYIRAMKGVDDASARNFRIKTEDPLVGRAYKSGEPILIGDRGWQRVKTEYFVKSLLYVPMTYKGQTIGVLGVNNRLVDRVFTAHDQELLLDLAAHAAIAIENARLYEERLLQNRQLTTLVEAGKAVNSTLALDDVLSTICQQIIQALSVSACLIGQDDPANSVLRPLASTRRAVWRPEQGPVTRLDDRPVMLQAISQNAYYAVTREQQGGKWTSEQQWLEREGAERLIMIPVRSGNQPAIGTLELYYRGSAPEVTSDFRAQVRAVALSILALIMQRSSTLPTTAIFNDAQKLLDMSRANCVILSLLPGNQIVRVVEFGTTVFLHDPRPQRVIFPSNVSAFEDVSTLNYTARDADLPKPVRAAMTAYGAATMLCLPLIIKGKTFGSVTIYDTLEPRRFSAKEISLAWALVAQAATALENARLYHDLEQSLSDLRQAQASLVQAARLSTMGELAAVVAHQINNPLTTIMVDAEIILQDLKEGDELHEGVTAIYRAGQRAHAVVKRLLSTARRSSPGEALQWISANETITNTLELVTTHVERSSVRLEVDLDDAAPVYVRAAPGHLEDLWLNLLLNAKDALVNIPKAKILINSKLAGDELVVTVQDNGPGIPPEHLPHLFEPFFTTKPAGEGTGLGLYICKQIVDQSQGKIEVDTVVGQGTSFRVRLPVRGQKG